MGHRFWVPLHHGPNTGSPRPLLQRVRHALASRQRPHPLDTCYCAHATRRGGRHQCHCGAHGLRTIDHIVVKVDVSPPGRYFHLFASGCRVAAPVWVHERASVPLCEPCRERAGRGCPKARWALRHSGQMSCSAWRVIQRRDLQEVQVDGVRSANDPSAMLPLLLWWAALCGDSGVLWLWHFREGPATQ